MVDGEQQATPRGGWCDPLLLPGLAAVLLLDGAMGRYSNGITPLGVLAVALVVVPLRWRREQPLVVLGVVIAGVFACLATLKPTYTVVLPPMVALYAVARYGTRARSLAVAGISVGVVALAVGVSSPHGVMSMDTLVNGVLAVLAIVAGDAVRSRAVVRRAAQEREAQLAAEREADAERRVAEERLRIARDVHDVVAHAMVAINVQAGVAAHVLERRPDQAQEMLVEIKRVSGTALTDLRATLGLLREDGGDAPTRPIEGLDGVAELGSALRSAGVEVELSVVGEPGRVSAPVGAAAYRIVQESLTNVLRHAGARHAEVLVAIEDDAVRVDVRDDGGNAAGALSLGPGTGSGLRGMAERAQAIGGALHAGPTGHGGWHVSAELPLA